MRIKNLYTLLFLFLSIVAWSQPDFHDNEEGIGNSEVEGDTCFVTFNLIFYTTANVSSQIFSNIQVGANFPVENQSNIELAGVYTVASGNGGSGNPGGSNPTSSSCIIYAYHMDVELAIPTSNCSGASVNASMNINYGQVCLFDYLLNIDPNYLDIQCLLSADPYFATLNYDNLCYREFDVAGVCCSGTNPEEAEDSQGFNDLDVEMQKESSKDKLKRTLLAAPNPFNSSLKISSILKGDVIKLHNVSGKQVSAEFVRHNGFINMSQSELQSGIYILTIERNNEIISVQRVVKE